MQLLHGPIGLAEQVKPRGMGDMSLPRSLPPFTPSVTTCRRRREAGEAGEGGEGWALCKVYQVAQVRVASPKRMSAPTPGYRPPSGRDCQIAKEATALGLPRRKERIPFCNFSILRWGHQRETATATARRRGQGKLLECNLVSSESRLSKSDPWYERWLVVVVVVVVVVEMMAFPCARMAFVRWGSWAFCCFVRRAAKTSRPPRMDLLVTACTPAVRRPGGTSQP